MKPSLFSLCILLAALWSLFLWELISESITCHQVFTFISRATPTTPPRAISTPFTPPLRPSTLTTAISTRPANRQASTRRKSRKEGTQQVCFHFLFPETHR